MAVYTYFLGEPIYLNLFFSVAKIPLYEACLPSDVCLDEQAGCIRGRCDCIPGYVERFGTCVARIPLGQPCVLGLDVCADDNALCQNGFCLCDDAYFARIGVCGELLLLEQIFHYMLMKIHYL